MPQVLQVSNVLQAPPTLPQKFKLIFNKNALKKIERGNVGHYFFRLTNNTTNYEELVYILARLVEPIHTQQHLAQLNILTVFFEPTTMVAEAEEKLQYGGEIANMLMSAFGVTIHEGRHIDEETGKPTIQVLRMNVMNPHADTDEQEVKKELHKTGIVDYNNLIVFYNQYAPDEVSQISFLVDSEAEIKHYTTAVINIQLCGVWYRLEESLSNYN
jgi:hypothetical protein